MTVSTGSVALIVVCVFSAVLFLALALFAEVSPIWRAVDVVLAAAYGAVAASLITAARRRNR